MPTLKQALAQKITSFEQFESILLEVSIHNREFIPGEYSGRKTFPQFEYFYDATARPIWHCGSARFRSLDGSEGSLHKSRWWLAREWLRLASGVYEYTPALVTLGQHFPELAVHCATDADDPTLVAYTIDHSKGEGDIQTRISLGRLLRKLYPQLPDDIIASAEADHRAALSSELDLLPWGKEFLKAYKEANPACMSKSIESYSGGHHPTAAYDVPWLKLAVLRNGKGAYSARALTYINPDDANDKRYIRIYGDMMLQRRLEKNGYRCAGLEGVRLKKVAAKGYGSTAFVMPYLDAPGHNTAGEKCGQYLAHDGDYLMVISQALADKLYNITRLGRISATSTSGAVEVPERLALAALKTRCPISGVEFTPDSNSLMVHANGADCFVHPNYVDAVASWPRVYVYVNHDAVKRNVPPDSKLIDREGVKYLVSSDMLEYLGYGQLDPEFYGPDQYESAHAKVMRSKNGYMIKTEDAVDFVDANGGYSTLHKSEVDADSLIKIARVASARPMYADKNAPIVRTVSGKRVVVGVHPVSQAFDGSYDYNDRLKMYRWGGVTFRAPAGSTFDIIPADIVASQVVEALAGRVGIAVANAVDAETDDTSGLTALYLLRTYGRVCSWVPSISQDGHVSSEPIPSYSRLDDIATAKRLWATAMAIYDRLNSTDNPLTVSDGSAYSLKETARRCLVLKLIRDRALACIAEQGLRIDLSMEALAAPTPTDAAPAPRPSSTASTRDSAPPTTTISIASYVIAA